MFGGFALRVGFVGYGLVAGLFVLVRWFGINAIVPVVRAVSVLVNGCLDLQSFCLFRFVRYCLWLVWLYGLFYISGWFVYCGFSGVNFRCRLVLHVVG